MNLNQMNKQLATLNELEKLISVKITIEKVPP
jgi:hypothetical protein